MMREDHRARGTGLATGGDVTGKTSGTGGWPEDIGGGLGIQVK